MTAKFWIGGAGTWDNTGDTHWSLSSGGPNNTTHPVAGDTATLDGASGGGTVTVAADLTLSSITCGAFTGTLDFSANNNNVNLASSFSATGSATRTINLGNGIWTISSVGGTVWNIANITGLTFNANSSTILITGTPTSGRSMSSGALTYSTITIAANTSAFPFSFANSITITNLNVTGPNSVLIAGGLTITVTNLSLAGTSGNEIFLAGITAGTTSSISVASGSPTMTWLALRDITCSGGATFNAANSFDLQHNSGVTITAPTPGTTNIHVSTVAANITDFRQIASY